ncbi:MAG: enoyl-CoA hydratase/isomerase family protein [Nitrospinota bacterium]|nr:enoyl-CoA hydratase/isomerase family protein [Nitrospinota bacterium]
MPDEFENILYEEGAGRVTVTINRPPLNLIDLETFQEMQRALRRARKVEGLKALVLTGSGEQAFSAGITIESFTPERIQGFLDVARGTMGILEEMDVVTIAAIKGLALGGGCELASCCDLILAADTAQFGFPEVKAGLFPPVGVAVLPRLVGLRKALELVLTGDIIGPHEAQKLGLVNLVHPLEEFDRAVTRFVGRINRASAAVLRIARRALYASADTNLKIALDRSGSLYLHDQMNTEDAHEGLAAFREHRRPRWKNR